MECNNWIQNGLLYASDELSAEEKNTFEIHMHSCTFCRTEHALYQKEKSTLFTPEALLESTTPEIDSAIRTACMKIPRPTTSGSIFSVVLKRSTISALFIILGLGVPVYFAFNVQNAKRYIANSNAKASVQISQTQTAVTPAPLLKNDSLLDDSVKAASNAKIVKPMGNLYENGVVPVDVKNE